MTRPLNLENISPKLQRIATRAWEAPPLVFNSLAHLVDVELLRVAYQRTRKDGARGIDDQSGAQYAQTLDANLALNRRFALRLDITAHFRRVAGGPKMDDAAIGKQHLHALPHSVRAEQTSLREQLRPSLRSTPLV